MSATENKRSIIVGLFVFIGIAILIAGIFVLGGQQNQFAKTVNVTTSFKDVGGLKVGNNVWFSGVKVGTVKAVSFSGLDQVEVTLAIEEKSSQFIRKDAVAKLGTDGFIGNKLILIEGGTPQAPAIQNGDWMKPMTAGGLDEMMGTLQVNNENFVAITEELKVLMAGLNQGQGTLGAVLTDSVMAVHVRTMIENLNKTTENTAKASLALIHLTDQMTKDGNLINDLLTDTVVYGDLKAAVAQLHGITATASKMVENLEEATGQLASQDNTIGMLLTDDELAEGIKRTMENLESSTQKLDQNMEALQHNFLFRGYFKKQEKENKK